MDWTSSAIPGIKYFSGEATYSKEIFLAPKSTTFGQLVLDLGAVRELAEVSIDGKTVGAAWHAPFRVTLPPNSSSGRHRLDIKVVNLWVNRLIGDKQPNATAVAFAPQSPYAADSPLLPSGLLGPVRILFREHP